MKFLLAMTIALSAIAGDWQKLFDGKTLKGWKTEGGAVWSVQDGVIVGKQGPKGESGDLFTEAKWADFDVEAEWKMKFPGNSGLWFRYTAADAAYQADFLEDPGHPDILSGSLYCMGKAFIAYNKDAKSLKRGEWNKIRVKATGDEIVIWSNGREVIRTHDGTFRAAGHIGIQVHAGGKLVGMEVRMRNIRIKSGEGK
jgi:hypothetical protein